MRPQHDLPLLGRKQEQTASIKDQIYLNPFLYITERANEPKL